MKGFEIHSNLWSDGISEKRIKSFFKPIKFMEMTTSHTFGIDFLIRRCKTDKTKAIIYVRIILDGERREISIKEKIDASSWDPQKEIVRGNSIPVKQINKAIDDICLKIKAQYRALQENGCLITADTIKNAYLGIHASQKGHMLKELADYFTKIWESKINFKNYKTTIEYLHRFLESKRPSKDIYLSQLNMEFVTDFEYFVRHNSIKENDPCLGNGIPKHIQRLKRIVNWAVEIEWMKINPFEKYHCTIKRAKRKKLAIDQLVTLENKDFSDPPLKYAKDLFLFSCYTGFAFADVMQLTQSHFEWDTDGTVWCKIYRMKSDTLSPIPLLKDAADIIRRYKDHPESKRHGKIFPPVTNQHVNRLLKLIKDECGFLLDFTFHIARHTFAKTVALKNGIPIETVQLMLGHTKITTTLIYAEVDEEKILHDMNGLEEKLESKRAIVIEKLNKERLVS